MYKRFQLFTPIFAVLMVLSALLVFLTPFFSTTLFFISAALALVGFSAVLLMLRNVGRRANEMLAEISAGIMRAEKCDYINFPVPVLMVYEGSEIIWYNPQCCEKVFGGSDFRGEDIAEILPDLDLSPKDPEAGQNVRWGNRQYTAYIAPARREGETVTIIYLFDDTEMKNVSAEYYRTRQSVALLLVDNYEELLQDYKESECTQFIGTVAETIEQYFKQRHGYVIRLKKDKFLAIVEEQGLEQILAGKFDLLDRVRALSGPNRMHATLSIGVGRAKGNLAESEQMARQALDMCLGRGGDQVAIKTQNGYDFYGGVSKGVEKRTKVKTRIMADALAELIKTAGNVIIMGHRFADLDALGSAIGVLKAVKAMDKSAFICIDREKNLVDPLLDKLLSNGYSEADFVMPDDTLNRIDEHTLLIIVDTHAPHVLESLEVYKACETVAVIDHHRKLVNHIDNAVIFYHEPYASSASEMVAELVQYFPVNPQIGPLEAEAMLAGIMLDTKNFVMRTGVRTFEAAAYLRKLGADTIAVRKLFANSIEDYQQKAKIVSTANVYRRCAITQTEEPLKDVKIVAAQAADELTGIQGVDASFAIFRYGDSINVSARSMGRINVQVIMEKLGGGGHQTMAAAQFPGETLENIVSRVKQTIDEYYDTKPEAAV